MQEFKKKHGSGTTTLIISNKKINDIITIVEALEDFSILLKEVTKEIKNKIKERKGRLLGMLLGTLGASFFGKYVSSERNCKSWVWK